jgi:hypothetical protein
MKRACDGCGREYEARRVTSRYCGSTCRTRASRAGTSSPRPAPAVAEVVAAASAPATTAERPAPFDPAAVILSATARTIVELEEAGRLDTSLGQVAVLLAQRLDASYRDTGSAVATLARQHAAQMSAALANANREASPTEKAKDELARRRSQRSA